MISFDLGTKLLEKICMVIIKTQLLEKNGRGPELAGMPALLYCTDIYIIELHHESRRLKYSKAGGEQYSTAD